MATKASVGTAKVAAPVAATKAGFTVLECTAVKAEDRPVEVLEEVEVVEYTGDKKITRKETAMHTCIKTVHTCVFNRKDSYCSVELSVSSLATMPYVQGQKYTLSLEPLGHEGS